LEGKEYYEKKYGQIDRKTKKSVGDILLQSIFIKRASLIPKVTGPIAFEVDIPSQQQFANGICVFIIG